MYAVLYECETWSRTERGRGSRIRLKKVSVPDRKEISSRPRKTDNGELRGLYCTSNVICVLKSRVRWSEYVARMAETIHEYKV